MPAISNLSNRQRAIVEYMWEFFQRFMTSPTVREIADGCGLKSSGAAKYQLEQLEKAGIVERTEKKSRAYVLAEEALSSIPWLQLDIGPFRNVRIPVCGEIVAGEPVEMGGDAIGQYGADELVSVEFKEKPSQVEQLFALRVRGDSMVDANVNDGDMVILRKLDDPHRQVRDGDIVAAWLVDKGETTLKHLFREGKNYRLQPANVYMEPIFEPAENVDIKGKLVRVVRYAE